MFPKAPNVQVYAPTALVAGQQVVVEIITEAEEPVKVEYIDATITGKQGWRVGSGKSSVVVRAEYPALKARLREAGELRAGRSSFHTSFLLPADMPPSHLIQPAWAWLELKVRVAIPWWPDGKYAFTLPVRVPAPATVERRPYAIRSTAAAAEPRIELSLASTSLIAGETVVGSCAVFQLDDRKPRDVELMLVPSFKLHRGGRYRERRGETLGITVTIPAGGAGTSVPFRFKLPADIAPTFSTVTHELAWWLVAKSGSFFGTKVEVNVPLTIYDASAAANTERLTVAPRLTDERISGAFAQFASEHGWSEAVDEQDPDQLAYERDAGDATLRLGYAYRGEQGAFLVAKVIYPSLGLGLSVTPSSRVRELLSKDIEVSIAQWDRAHHVTARSATQTLSFLTTMVPRAIDAAKPLGGLRAWNDDEIGFERQVSAIESHDLSRAAEALEALANHLAGATLQTPPQLEVDLALYRQLAQRLQGRLTVGDLTIEGTIDLRPVTIALEFDEDRPIRIYARVGEPEAAIDDSLPLDGRLDVAAVRELVLKLRADLASREPNQGPYR
ncbi:MAG TPA: hypothetical protein VIV40_41625 [Kofleriaceae bacterium]